MKAAALLLVLVVARALAETQYARALERTLAAWCLAFAALDAYSLTRILGGI